MVFRLRLCALSGNASLFQRVPNSICTVNHATHITALPLPALQQPYVLNVAVSGETESVSLVGSDGASDAFERARATFLLFRTQHTAGTQFQVEVNGAGSCHTLTHRVSVS